MYRNEPKDPDFELIEEQNQDGGPRIEKRAARRIVSCTGCGMEHGFGLLTHHGAAHRGCQMTAGVVGYWVEVPQADVYVIVYPNGMSLPVPPQPEEPDLFSDVISAAEKDYIKSWGGD